VTDEIVCGHVSEARQELVQDEDTHNNLAGEARDSLPLEPDETILETQLIETLVANPPHPSGVLQRDIALIEKAWDDWEKEVSFTPLELFLFFCFFIYLFISFDFFEGFSLASSYTCFYLFNIIFMSGR